MPPDTTEEATGVENIVEITERDIKVAPPADSAKPKPPVDPKEIAARKARLDVLFFNQGLAGHEGLLAKAGFDVSKFESKKDMEVKLVKYSRGEITAEELGIKDANGEIKKKIQKIFGDYADKVKTGKDAVRAIKTPTEKIPDQKTYDRYLAALELAKQNPGYKTDIGLKPEDDPAKMKTDLKTKFESSAKLKEEPMPVELTPVIAEAGKALNDPKVAVRFRTELIKFLKSPKGKEWLKSPEGKIFAEKIKGILVNKTGLQALKLEAGGLLAGLITILGAEAVVDILGIENKSARFVLVLGLSHLANLKTQDILAEAVMGKKYAEAAKIAKLLENPTVLGRVMVQLKDLGTGLAKMAFVSIVTKGVLDAVKVEDPKLREWIEFTASFVVPSIANFASEQLAVKLGESALAKTGIELVSKAFGKLTFAIGLANLLTDGVTGLLSSNYGLLVRKRVYDQVQTDKAGKGGWSLAGCFTTEFFHLIGGSANEAAVANDHKDEIQKTVKGDIEETDTTRKELSAELFAFVSKGGELGVLTVKQSFGTLILKASRSVPLAADPGVALGRVPKFENIQIKVSEKEVFEFLSKYMKEHPGTSFESKDLIGAVQKKFGGEITAVHLVKIFEKGIIISWQARFAMLHFIQPSIFIPGSTVNDDIRGWFSNDGVLKGDKLAEFRAKFLSK